jgi:hypothetical protein
MKRVIYNRYVKCCYVLVFVLVIYAPQTLGMFQFFLHNCLAYPCELSGCNLFTS